LTALFQMPDVSKHLDPPPATIADFGSWIALSQSRRAEGRAACYSLVTGDDEVAGLFMALRFEDPIARRSASRSRRTSGAPACSRRSIDVYLDFLFNDWGIKTLVGKTQVSNVRAHGRDAQGRREGDRRERAKRARGIRLDDRTIVLRTFDERSTEFYGRLKDFANRGANLRREVAYFGR
jgi:hypothetical protein